MLSSFGPILIAAPFHVVHYTSYNLYVVLVVVSIHKKRKETY